MQNSVYKATRLNSHIPVLQLKILIGMTVVWIRDSYRHERRAYSLSRQLEGPSEGNWSCILRHDVKA